jgi:alginate O-acetyltransferase complex protein AlgJ
MDSLKRLIGRCRRPRGIGQVAVVIAFLVILYTPGIRMIVDPPKSNASKGWEDNRPMPRLAWRLESILSFPRDFAEYFQFNFGYRSNLISMRTKLIGEALHESTSQAVLEGKEGWLFLGEAGPIENYRGLLPFSEAQLERWKQALESRHNWLARHNIHYLLVVCPDKHTIYPEYMPDRINRVRAETRLDQLVRYLRKNRSDVEILDLRPALTELKKQRLCYQPQETHWNDVGAFVAYQQIARRLTVWYPGLRVMDMKDCEVYQRKNLSTDLLRLQGKEKVTTLMDSLRPIHGFVAKLEVDPNGRDEKRVQLEHSRRSDAPAGRLLMIHDSFGIPIVPFLAEHFREGWYVWTRGDRFFPKEVLTFKPDVVVQEFVERQLCEREPTPLGLAASGDPNSARTETDDPPPH